MEKEGNNNLILDMEARMYAPLQWESFAPCKIQDLKAAQYEEALRLIKHHFFREEPMCQAASLQEDSKSVNEFLNLIKTWMKDSTSLVALSLTSGRVIGVAVTRINNDSDKTDTYNRVLKFEGNTLENIMRLINAVIKQTNVYRELECEAYFRVHLLCVHPSYQKKGIGMSLLTTCVQVASTLKMSAIGGVFTSGLSQSLATKVGFSLISEIRYSRWVVNDNVVFDDPGKGNYSAAFMGMIISSQESIHES
ncbi:PREDICTED: uncharacterized protein LOC106749100 [Dinoponera quadriceps]|uniref:aralkylamine N-acetyltransferase n=1 Tax=Dinoponera quadriceps TaxID=609295 RepID=A0A6P3Y0F9_DINQU|nr:PREDICTED: uncharacterized protein LOC106749100 [Dinoponera quadriceps]